MGAKEKVISHTWFGVIYFATLSVIYFAALSVICFATLRVICSRCAQCNLLRYALRHLFSLRSNVICPPIGRASFTSLHW